MNVVDRWRRDSQFCGCRHPNRYRCGFLLSRRCDATAECRCHCHAAVHAASEPKPEPKPDPVPSTTKGPR